MNTIELRKEILESLKQCQTFTETSCCKAMWRLDAKDESKKSFWTPAKKAIVEELC